MEVGALLVLLIGGVQCGGEEYRIPWAILCSREGKRGDRANDRQRQFVRNFQELCSPLLQNAFAAGLKRKIIQSVVVFCRSDFHGRRGGPRQRHSPYVGYRRNRIVYRELGEEQQRG